MLTICHYSQNSGTKKWNQNINFSDYAGLGSVAQCKFASSSMPTTQVRQPYKFANHASSPTMQVRQPCKFAHIELWGQPAPTPEPYWLKGGAGWLG